MVVVGVCLFVRAHKTSTPTSTRLHDYNPYLGAGRCRSVSVRARLLTLTVTHTHRHGTESLFTDVGQ